MLKRVGEKKEKTPVPKGVRLGEADFPSPFYQGLEYSSPARGTWNIVHTGMLIPQSHQIFVCAQGCLRGVVLTAAEMGAMDRYSSISIREENVLCGDMEELMIEGVSDILKKLGDARPKAMLLFISCQHFFLAYDQQHVFEVLRERFPDIYFLDCYMIPTLRKSGLTPDQKMRVQLFRLLEPRVKKEKCVNVIGNNLAIQSDCEWFELLQMSGWQVKQIQDCQTFEEYLDMATATENIVCEPMAVPLAKDLETRLEQSWFYMENVFSLEKIQQNYDQLAEHLQLQKRDFQELQNQVIEEVKKTRQQIGETEIVVDYTFTFRILSLVRFLLEQGFRVSSVYVDAFLPEEKEDFLWLQENYPELMILPTNQPEMRFAHSAEKEEKEEKKLALGQKAAYFSGTSYFVNVVEGGGFFGYRGMLAILERMRKAFLEKKDSKALIQQKGYGCECCICSDEPIL